MGAEEAQKGAEQGRMSRRSGDLQNTLLASYGMSLSCVSLPYLYGVQPYISDRVRLATILKQEQEQRKTFQNIQHPTSSTAS